MPIDAQKVTAGEAVLLKYNTRVNPREYEVTSDIIFSELFHQWGMEDFSRIEVAKEAFYSFFFTNTSIYPDVMTALARLKDRGIKIGLLTDGAYGSDRQYTLYGTGELSTYLDVILTSTEVCFRKPHAAGYLRLAKELNTDVTDCIFVGDEEKDIVGANRVGMVSVLIDRHSHNPTWSQKHTVRSLEELIPLLSE